MEYKMDNHTAKSYLGEISLIKYLTSENWETYVSASGKSKYDLIAYHEKYGLKTFQVKCLFTENNEVFLRSIRPNKTQNKVVPFDNTNQDILVVYSVVLDKLFFFNSSLIKNKSSMRVDFNKNLSIKDCLQG